MHQPHNKRYIGYKPTLPPPACACCLTDLPVVDDVCHLTPGPGTIHSAAIRVCALKERELIGFHRKLHQLHQYQNTQKISHLRQVSVVWPKRTMWIQMAQNKHKKSIPSQVWMNKGIFTLGTKVCACSAYRFAHAKPHPQRWWTEKKSQVQHLKAMPSHTLNRPKKHNKQDLCSKHEHWWAFTDDANTGKDSPASERAVTTVSRPKIQK